jgi:hypothetical protein
MKSSKTAISILFLSAVCVTPAFANYFSNPTLNVHFNVGSAPNPSVRDIRENHMPQMTRATSQSVDVVAEKSTVAPAQKDRVETAPARSADASDTIPALRLRYL